MNELERMIAGLEVPGPSNRLDDRIDVLFAAERNAPNNNRRRQVVAVCAMTCIGAIGFVFGRLSAAPTNDAPSTTTPANIAMSDIPPPAAAMVEPVNITRIPLENAELAGLFVHSSVREGMFGAGPMTLKISTPELKSRN